MKVPSSNQQSRATDCPGVLIGCLPLLPEFRAHLHPLFLEVGPPACLQAMLQVWFERRLQ